MIKEYLKLVRKEKNMNLEIIYAGNVNMWGANHLFDMAYKGNNFCLVYDCNCRQYIEGKIQV
jgi:hypothetical protein